MATKYNTILKVNKCGSCNEEFVISAKPLDKAEAAMNWNSKLCRTCQAMERVHAAVAILNNNLEVESFLEALGYSEGKIRSLSDLSVRTLPDILTELTEAGLRVVTKHLHIIEIWLKDNNRFQAVYDVLKTGKLPKVIQATPQKNPATNQKRGKVVKDNRSKRPKTRSRSGRGGGGRKMVAR